MRSTATRLALLLLLLLGVIPCRGSSTTISPTTMKANSAPVSSQPTVLTSGPAALSSPGITTTPKATTLATTLAQSSPSTVAASGSLPSRTMGTTGTPSKTSSKASQATPAVTVPPATSASSPSVVGKTSQPTSTKAASTASAPASTPLLGTALKGTVLATHSPVSASLVPTSKSPPSTAKSSATDGTTVPGSSGVTTPGKSTSNPSVSPTKNPGHVGPATSTVIPTTKQSEATKGSTATKSSGVTLRPPASSSGASSTTRTPSGTPEKHAPPPTSRANATSSLGQTQIVCEGTKTLEDRVIILTFNQSTPCNSLEKSPVKEPFLSTLCKSVKPNFNQDKDGCTVKLAIVKDDPKSLAVVGVSVETHSVDEELFESLAGKKGELGKIGVNNITYEGRTLDETEDRFSMPLIITIVCMAASLLLAAAIYGCCHQRLSQRKDQQRLTEELQTMENGYHDNPTLEVMETSSEMQEKKVNLNGELGDSWIVPMDSLTKEDLEDEEDTHL